MKLTNFYLLCIPFLILNIHAQTKPDLANKLDSIYQEDQKYRKQIGDVMKEHGQNSEELQDLFKTIVKKDSTNLIEVKSILDKYGWLGQDAVGKKGNQTLFLVIQHSDLETQKKYMPLMEQAVEDDKARSQNFALLKDRVLLGEGKKQVYGSQIGKHQETGEYYVRPLKDPENVNIRREEMDLGTIESYVSRWNIEWSVKNYLESIEKFENDKS